MIDFLFAMIEHFLLALKVKTLRPDIGRSRRFSKGVGHFKHKFQVERVIAPNLFWCHKTRIDYPFMWCQNFSCMFFRFFTKHACDGRTDGQTDAQNWNPQDCARIAALNGKTLNDCILTTARRKCGSFHTETTKGYLCHTVDTHPGRITSNPEQVANLLCAQAKSAY